MHTDETSTEPNDMNSFSYGQYGCLMTPETLTGNFIRCTLPQFFVAWIRQGAEDIHWDLSHSTTSQRCSTGLISSDCGGSPSTVNSKHIPHTITPLAAAWMAERSSTTVAHVLQGSTRNAFRDVCCLPSYCCLSFRSKQFDLSQGIFPQTTGCFLCKPQRCLCEKIQEFLKY